MISRRFFRSGCGVLALVTAGFWANSARSLMLTVTDQERGIFAEAESGESGGFDADVDPAETKTMLPYWAYVTSNANTAHGFATAYAFIDSDFASDSLFGWGTADASAYTLAVDVLARAPSDSHFEAVFSPDVTESVAFVGRIDTDAIGAQADSHTRIVLSNAVTGVVLSSHSAGLGGDLIFAEFVVLESTQTYRLSATSLARAQAADVVESSSAEASYVVYVPEPGVGLQLVTGWVGVLALHASRKRRSLRKISSHRESRC